MNKNILFLIFLIFFTFISNAFFLTTEEKLYDFDQMVSYLNKYYSMLEVKEKHGILDKPYNQIVQDYRKKIQNTENETDFYNLMRMFFNEFKDAHLSISKVTDQYYYVLPIDFNYIDGITYVRSNYNSDKYKIGDVLLSFNGKRPIELLKKISDYAQVGGREESRLSSAVNYLDFRNQNVFRPEKKDVLLKLKKYDTGEEYEVKLQWNYVDLGQIVRSKSPKIEEAIKHISSFSDYDIDRYENPMHAFLELEKGIKNKIYGNSETLYRDNKGIINVFKNNIVEYKGYKIGILVVPSYSGNYSDYEYYKKIIKQMMDCDAILLNQMNNGGGSSHCATKLLSMLTDKSFFNLKSSIRLFRNWISYVENSALYPDYLNKKYDSQAGKRAAKVFEILAKDYKENKRFSTPFPLGYIFDDIIEPDKEVQFNKPVLVLIDENCYSSGDIFPALIKNNSWNGRIKLIGNTTAGAGGNVNSYGPLVNSEINFSMTESIVINRDGSYIEDNGVEPDIFDRFTYKDLIDYYIKGNPDYVNRKLDILVDMIENNK